MKKYQVELFLLHFEYSVTSQVGFTGVSSQKDRNTNNFSILHANIFKLGTCASLRNSNQLREFCDVTIPISPIIPILVNPANFRYSD